MLCVSVCACVSVQVCAFYAMLSISICTSLIPCSVRKLNCVCLCVLVMCCFLHMYAFFTLCHAMHFSYLVVFLSLPSAAAIYMCCQLEDLRRTQTEICKATNLTEVTLRKVKLIAQNALAHSPAPCFYFSSSKFSLII